MNEDEIESGRITLYKPASVEEPGPDEEPLPDDFTPEDEECGSADVKSVAAWGRFDVRSRVEAAEADDDETVVLVMDRDYPDRALMRLILEQNKLPVAEGDNVMVIVDDTEVDPNLRSMEPGAGRPMGDKELMNTLGSIEFVVNAEVRGQVAHLEIRDGRGIQMDIRPREMQIEATVDTSSKAYESSRKTSEDKVWTLSGHNLCATDSRVPLDR